VLQVPFEFYLYVENIPRITTIFTKKINTQPTIICNKKMPVSETQKTTIEDIRNNYNALPLKIINEAFEAALNNGTVFIVFTHTDNILIPSLYVTNYCLKYENNNFRFVNTLGLSREYCTEDNMCIEKSFNMNISDFSNFLKLHADKNGYKCTEIYPGKYFCSLAEATEDWRDVFPGYKKLVENKEKIDKKREEYEVEKYKQMNTFEAKIERNSHCIVS
jgi:hypothetical protein